MSEFVEAILKASNKVRPDSDWRRSSEIAPKTYIRKSEISEIYENQKGMLTVSLRSNKEDHFIVFNRSDIADLLPKPRKTQENHI